MSKQRRGAKGLASLNRGAGKVKQLRLRAKAHQGKLKDVATGQPDEAAQSRDVGLDRARRRRRFEKGVITSILFKIMDEEDIIGYDLCQVTNSAIDAGDMVNMDGGGRQGCLLDRAMGPSSRSEYCSKCGGDDRQCIGHPGYIKLNAPIFHPVYIKQIKQIMTLFDFEAWKRTKFERDAFVTKRTTALLAEQDIQARMTPEQIEEQRELIYNDPSIPKVIIRASFDPTEMSEDYGNYEGPKRLGLIYDRHKKARFEDKKASIEYKIDNTHYIKMKVDPDSEGCYLDPRTIKSFFAAIDNDVFEDGTPKRWTHHIGFGDNRLESLVMMYVPVLANTVRPTTILFQGMTVKNPINEQYKKLVDVNNEIGRQLTDMDMSNGEGICGKVTASPFNKLIGGMADNDATDKVLSKFKVQNTKQLYDLLNQVYHDLLFAKDETGDEEQSYLAASEVKSISTEMNGKTGALRQDTLGKRAGYSGRGVIIGDPSIDVDEVGLSIIYATVITVPEIVKTDEDIQFWTDRMPVLNAEGKASDTNIVMIERRGIPKMFGPGTGFDLRKGDIVRRKLQDGDIVTLTRQPVLHKGSNMAFYVRIFPEDDGAVIRINPAVTGPYNADFDGDEMNFAVPQNEFEQADVIKKMLVTRCIKSDQTSGAMIGAIQNTIVASNLITDVNKNIIVPRDTIIDMYDAAEFSRRNPEGNFSTDYKDTLRRAEQLGLNPYSGHAVFSILLPKGFYYNRRVKGEDDVVVTDGILVSGKLHKKDVGRTSGGLIDTMLDQFGPNTVIMFLSALQRAMALWLERYGFTLEADSCILPDDDSQKTIDEILRQSREDVIELLSKSKPPEGQQSSLTRSEKQSQESRVRTILGQARDRINKIVRAGGVDIIDVKRRLAEEIYDKGFHEAAAFAADLVDSRTEQGEMLSLVAKEFSDSSIKRDTTRYSRELEVLTTIGELIHEADDTRFVRSDIFGSSGERLREQYKKRIDQAFITRTQMIKGSDFDTNFLRIVLSGAKGTETNLLQVMGLLGQQEIDGERIEANMADNSRTLPFFPRRKHGDHEPEAQGHCSSSISKGLSLAEYFFHAKASRNNIVEANLKPGDTGYFYRRLALKMESKRTNASGAVVDNNGRIVSFMYGGDGMDPTRVVKVNGLPQFANVQNIVTRLRGQLQNNTK